MVALIPSNSTNILRQHKSLIGYRAERYNKDRWEGHTREGGVGKLKYRRRRNKDYRKNRLLCLGRMECPKLKILDHSTNRNTRACQVVD